MKYSESSSTSSVSFIGDGGRTAWTLHGFGSRFSLSNIHILNGSTSPFNLIFSKTSMSVGFGTDDLSDFRRRLNLNGTSYGENRPFLRAGVR